MIKKRKPTSDETKRKISEANKGKKRTPEQRKRISLSVMENTSGRGNKGKSPSIETRIKLSIAGRKRIMTQETRERLSKALKGNRNPAGRILSPEARQKISKANTGRIKTAETRLKSSIAHLGKSPANKGKPLSKETKARLSLLATKAVKEGRIGIKYTKKPKYTMKDGRTIRFRSSWEYKVAEYLDRLNIVWEYEFSILSLNGMSYLPDFFIFDLSDILIKIIEVKGYFREDKKEKFYNFQSNYHIPIELWNQEKLKELGIL